MAEPTTSVVVMPLLAAAELRRKIEVLHHEAERLHNIHVMREWATNLCNAFLEALPALPTTVKKAAPSQLPRRMMNPVGGTISHGAPRPMVGAPAPRPVAPPPQAVMVEGDLTDEKAQALVNGEQSA